jgi:hypothetical protein
MGFADTKKPRLVTRLLLNMARPEGLTARLRRLPCGCGLWPHRARLRLGCCAAFGRLPFGLSLRSSDCALRAQFEPACLLSEVRMGLTNTKKPRHVTRLFLDLARPEGLLRLPAAGLSFGLNCCAIQRARGFAARFEPACLLSEVRMELTNTKKPRQVTRLLLDLARPEGFEPPTAWFVARYSIQLSYGRVVKRSIMGNRLGRVKPVG